MNPSELALQVAADRAAFAAEHQGRGEIAVGDAFVPNAKHAELGKDRLKLVEEAFGHPCKKCNWTGLEPCKKCSGNGLVKCTNSDCKGGWAVVLPRSKYLLISWLQSPSAVIWEPRKIKSDTVSTVSPSISHEVMGVDAMIFFF